MQFLASSLASDKSDATLPSTGTDAAGWRRFWADESIRVGTNWRSLLSLHLEICDHLRAASSSWCRS
jgi:hypothetical protein